MQIEYSIVIPVYNSGEWLGELTSRIINAMQCYTDEEFEIILVNDCSPSDNVWTTMREISNKNKSIISINTLYNNGQFLATICGLEIAKGKYVITMDDDLQHLPEELPKMIDAIKNGNYDCVFGVYEEVKQRSYRRLGSKFTNYLVTKLYGRPKGVKSNSFRIMKNELAQTITNYKSAKPQISPIIFLCTKNIGNVIVEHHEREYGKSGYSIKKLVTETVNSIINVSTLPLDIVSIIGITSSLIAFVLGLVYLIKYIIGDIKVAGFTAQILVTVFFGGLILFSIGILGKYIQRIIREITGLPKYIIKESVNYDKEETINE